MSNQPVTFSMNNNQSGSSEDYVAPSFFSTLLNNIRAGFNSLSIDVSTDSAFDNSRIQQMSPAELSRYSGPLVDLYGMTRETMNNIKDDIDPLQLSGDERQIAELPYEKKLKMRMEQQFKDKLQQDPLLKNFYDGLGREISSVSALVPQNNESPVNASKNLEQILNAQNGEFGQGSIDSIASLQNASVSGGLVNDFTGNVEFQDNANRQQQRRPINNDANLIDVINTTATNDQHFGNTDNLLNDSYRHDTYGSPYINSHRIQIEDFNYGLAGSAAGTFDQQEDVDESSAIDAIKQFLASSDNPKRDITLAISRYGSPAQLDALLKYLDPKVAPTQKEMERLKKIGVGANGLSLDHVD